MTAFTGPGVSPKPGSLKSLKLVNYKGFENYTINLRATNALVGANNAGKSTALGALRLIVAILLPGTPSFAFRWRPDLRGGLALRTVQNLHGD